VRIKAAILAVAMAASLTGSVLLGSAKDDVLLAMKDRVVRDLSSRGLTLAFHIGMTNQTSASRSLVRYRYRVTVNQREFLNMSVDLPEPIPAPPGIETLIALPVRITYELLFAAVGPIEERAACDVVGDLYFLTERKREQRFPFAFSGEFPIFKDPEIEIRPLAVGDLTVGGADVVFRAVFRNHNPYDLLIDRIDFRLEFGGQEVLSGPVPGDKSLPAKWEKEFSLPFLIDFFEAGEAMRDLFRGEEIACRFSGLVEAGSAWGRLLIPFDERRTLRFDRTLR
jgi:LEA14-like dessication related protein